jgi:hypothetical protein
MPEQSTYSEKKVMRTGTFMVAVIQLVKLGYPTQVIIDFQSLEIAQLIERLQQEQWSFKLDGW